MSEQKRLDRPEICRDCSRYKTDCQGSNQEDCARLDRPDREKIADKILPMTKVESYRGWQLRTADQILELLIPDIEWVREKANDKWIEVMCDNSVPALTPAQFEDAYKLCIEEAKKQERERIISVIEGYRGVEKAFISGEHALAYWIPDSVWQSLGEK